MLSEARIILPVNDNNGNPLDYAHQKLMITLCDIFGGATKMASEGIWRDPKTGRVYQEPGFAYDVAMVPSAENRNTLTKIAQSMTTLADQECVYIRHADGDVAFIEPSRAAA